MGSVFEADHIIALLSIGISKTKGKGSLYKQLIIICHVETLSTFTLTQWEQERQKAISGAFESSGLHSVSHQASGTRSGSKTAFYIMKGRLSFILGLPGTFPAPWMQK